MNFDRKSLGMKKVCAKIVSENLINDECQRMGEVCTDLLQQIEENCEWLNKIITGNESWVFHYDPGTNGQRWKSKSPGSSRSKRKSKAKTHVDLFLRLQRDNAWKVCLTWSDCQPAVFFLFLQFSERLSQQNHYVT